jgi:hypothetical protein
MIKTKSLAMKCSAIQEWPGSFRLRPPALSVSLHPQSGRHQEASQREAGVLQALKFRGAAAKPRAEVAKPAFSPANLILGLSRFISMQMGRVRGLKMQLETHLNLARREGGGVTRKVGHAPASGNNPEVR